MKKAKILLLTLCAVLLVVASVLGTLAYLTSESKVVNTFTVGKVNITLDETAVTPDGKPIDGADRVKSNNYHLVPGNTYTKDPTMTVVKTSEDAYVRMLVTLNCYDKLVGIFGESFLPQYFVNGWDNAVWTSTEKVDTSADGKTATYEFRYKEIVKKSDTDTKLDALFTSITVPENLSGEDLSALHDANFTITVVGHAIQASGFADANDAWTAFDNQTNN